MFEGVVASRKGALVAVVFESRHTAEAHDPGPFVRSTS
jgi:hypothetical protein